MASLAQRSEFIRRSAKSGNWLRAVFALRNELCTQPWRPAEVVAATSSNSAQSSPASSVETGRSTLPSALELFQQHGRRLINNDERANTCINTPNARGTNREENFSQGRSFGEVSSFQTSSLSSSTWAQTTSTGGLSAALDIGFGLDSIDCTTVNSFPSRRPASAKEKRDALELLIVGCESLLPLFTGTTPAAEKHVADAAVALRKVPADVGERGSFQDNVDSSQKASHTSSPLAALYLLSAADKGRVLHALPSSLLHEALFDFVIPLLEQTKAGEGKRSQGEEEATGSTCKSKQTIVLAQNLVFPLFKSFAVSISRNSRGARTFACDVFRKLEDPTSLDSDDDGSNNLIFKSIAVDSCGEVVDIERFAVISSVATRLLKKAHILEISELEEENNGKEPLFPLSPEDHMVLFALSLGAEAFSKLMLDKGMNGLSASASWTDLFARNRAFVSFAIREGTLVPFLASCWSHHHHHHHHHHQKVSSSTLAIEKNGVDTCTKGLLCVRGSTFSKEIIETLREILSDLATHSPMLNYKMRRETEELYTSHKTNVAVLMSIALCLRHCPRRAFGEGGPLGLLQETERLSKALALGNEQEAAFGEDSQSLVTNSEAERETSKQTELRCPYPRDLMPQFVLAASRCRVEYLRRATLILRTRRSRSCGERWRVLCELASDVFLSNELIPDRVTDILRQQRTALVASAVFTSYAPLSGAALRMMLDAPVKGLSTLNIFETGITSNRRRDKTQQNADEDLVDLGLIYKVIKTRCSASNNAQSTTFIAAAKNKKVADSKYGGGAESMNLPTLPDPRGLSPEELTLRAVFGSLATEVAIYSYLHLPSAANNGGPSQMTDEEVTTRVINSYSDAEVASYNEAVLRELLDRLSVDERSGGNSITSCTSACSSQKRLSYEALSFLLRMLRVSSVLNNSMVRAFAANGYSGVVCASLALPTAHEDKAWQIAQACLTQLTASHHAVKESEKTIFVGEEDAGCREGDAQQVEIAIYSMSVLTIALLARAPATAIGDSACATEGSIRRLLCSNPLSANEEMYKRVDPFSLQLLMRSCAEVLEAFRERKDCEQDRDAIVVEALRKVVGVVALVTQASVKYKSKLVDAKTSGSDSVKMILPTVVALLDEVTVSYGLK